MQQARAREIKKEDQEFHGYRLAAAVFLVPSQPAKEFDAKLSRKTGLLMGEDQRAAAAIPFPAPQHVPLRSLVMQLAGAPEPEEFAGVDRPSHGHRFIIAGLAFALDAFSVALVRCPKVLEPI